MVFDYRAYWEERGKVYMHQYGRAGYISYVNKLPPILKELKGIEKVLDVGCGYGRLTKALAEAYPKAKITGIDVSPPLLKEAEKYLSDYPNAGVALKDFLKYGPTKRFDLITEWCCFCHIPPELIHKAVERCHGLLRKKGGYVLLIDIPEGIRINPHPQPYQWAYDYECLFKDDFTLIRKMKNCSPGQDLFLFKKVV